MVWGRSLQRNTTDRNKYKQQKWLLCFCSVFRHSLSSAENAVIFRCLHRRFIPIVFVFLVLLLLFAFLSPTIFDHLQVQHRPLSTSLLTKSRAVSLRRDLWSTSSSEFYYGCSNATKGFLGADAKTHPDRYVLISTSGGLNQQRTGITDAVVAAYILNATLIVPMLDQKSYWKDASDFGDIFDVDWFITLLSNDVKILKALPTVGGKVVTPVHTRVPRKSSPKYYKDRILPLLNKKHAVQLTKFDYRLSNKLDADLQKLRCRVNYHALRFTDPIVELGRKMVDRMRMRSKHFIALHLRFEPDMLAFSGCDYGGGEKERNELGAIRRRWKTLNKRNPDKQRRQGKCPLTPEEVGLLLRALGFNSDVHIYVASGEIYGGQETLAPLRALFPNFQSKDTLASHEELAPFASYSARMAALDFIVCDESDVFVTNNNGNMARILAGRRRYYGHKPTIRPNAKKLYHLFLNWNNMTWEEFASGVRTHQVGFMGEPNEVKLGKGSFHENPSSCICESSLVKATGDSGLQDYSRDYNTGDVKDYQIFEDEQDSKAEDSLFEKGLHEESNEDPGLTVTSDQPELEDFLSNLTD